MESYMEMEIFLGYDKVGKEFVINEEQAKNCSYDL